MTAQRMMYLSLAIILSLGIGLTGYDKVHWVFYIPLAASIFAFITGICPNIVIWKKLGLK
ncbi:MAG: hypothetical protein IME93_04905 [Proteobacteria bacterium]|nr:hypothetical protein [Pseudomonadota bacterium]